MIWFCSSCTPISTPPSSLSWLSYGRLALSDHRIPIVCDHNAASLEPLLMPKSTQVALDVSIFKGYRSPNLARFILRNLMLRMFLALLAFAICASGLGDVDLRRMTLAIGKSGINFKRCRSNNSIQLNRHSIARCQRHSSSWTFWQVFAHML